jgi:hypothetical protein
MTASIHRRPDGRGSLWHRVRWWLPLLALAWCAEAFAAERVPFRVSISSTLFEDVNRNDAEAAIKVWGGVIAAERGVAVDPQTRIVNGVAGLRAELQERRVALIGARVDEFEALRTEFSSGISSCPCSRAGRRRPMWW